MNRRHLGIAGERRARRYLRRQGLQIIESNWRCRAGELDIIAKQADTLVVVEVRTASRKSRFAGGPLLTVGWEKQRRLSHLTRLWLQRSKWHPSAVRFDVIGLRPHRLFGWEIDWVPNAFVIDT